MKLSTVSRAVTNVAGAIPAQTSKAARMASHAASDTGHAIAQGSGAVMEKVSQGGRAVTHEAGDLPSKVSRASRAVSHEAGKLSTKTKKAVHRMTA